MKVSKQLMDAAGIKPKLKLGVKTDRGVQSTGPHKVKMISDKIINGLDRETGKVIEYVKYVVEEDGVQKEYRTRLKHKETGELQYLVQNLSQINEGEEVIMEMKKMGPKNYVEVRHVDGSKITDEEQDDVDPASEDITDDEVDEALNSVGIN
jgi:hypothetical protein